VGVLEGLQRDRQGRCHLVRGRTRHQPDIRLDIMASREDLLSLHFGDQHISSGHLIGNHNINISIDRSSSNLGLLNRTN
jgi:hypothetical protein